LVAGALVVVAPGCDEDVGGSPDRGKVVDSSSPVKDAGRDAEAITDRTDSGNEVVAGEDPVCGNGIIETGEVCDDGNTVDDEECSADCSVNHRCLDSVFEGDFIIENPEDIAGLDGHTAITGVLRIEGTELANLDGLECISSVGALQIMGNPLLTRIEGLIGLRRITGEATETTCCMGVAMPMPYDVQVQSEISDNRALTDLNGLRNLTSVKGTLTISTNDVLTDIHGLGALTDIDHLTISSNNALVALDGLNDIHYPYLQIHGNASLTSLESLSHLTSIGRLAVTSNSRLTNLRGLGNLTTLTSVLIHNNNSLTGLVRLDSGITKLGNLDISNNELLMSLDGLNNIGTIARSLIISNNASLTDLEGIYGITSVVRDLIIRSNARLSTCDAEALRENIGTGNIDGEIVICGNLPDACGSESCQ
jgi:cysteine-rich repeat protein